jgi:alcohol dehydrogenase (cytochrome c)
MSTRLRLLCADARTGKEVWKTHITDELKIPGGSGTMFGGSTGGVIIIKGRVLVGMTNCGRNGDDNHCYISAYDAQTGKRDWKFITTALTGQPGGDSWGKLPDNIARAPRPGSQAPMIPSSTPPTGAPPRPSHGGATCGSGDGATNYANSTLALDPEAGKMKWWYQHAPGVAGSHEVFETAGGPWRRKSLLTIGKPGILWKLDRVRASSSPPGRPSSTCL